MRRTGVRHSVAAILGVAGLALASIAAFASTATAASTSTVSLNCSTVVDPAKPPNTFAWPDAQFVFSATGPAGTAVTVEVSDLPAIAPVKMAGFPGTSKLVLTLGGTTTTLTGSGSITNGGANQPVPVPDLQGTLAFPVDSLPDVLTSFQLVVMGIATDCVLPTATPTPTPTTTTSATATPSASTSPTAEPTSKPTPKPTSKPGSDSGKPAKGSVDFACVLNPLNTDFDYPATVTVSGYRKKAGHDISLSAKMTDLPGISPVPIDGKMDVTLDVVVGKRKTTLKGSTHAVAPPRQKVPVPTLTGSVAGDDEVEVSVTGFTFNFAALSIDAACTADAESLGTMKVGSEPIEDDAGPDGSGTANGGSTADGGSLPQTGGGDALPVVALWALALVLLGAAGLLCVPQVARRKP
ncbi:hypothetical protein [Nocardioides soli]|uniref:Gram-positive cocci surface proteins LPxTG domain-containing protein n=1 Tax=Nocardioides soli TaxID=1036020 RepID=A0A7W4VXR8_9ACTN|nr:hypothetical protein [Nocardioides soli]MBB3043635.1 hypothetical protein [Nocardioides soli]